MEQVVKLHVEHLPEGVYLATSEEIPGLVAQGRTITETLEIARDVAKKLWRPRPNATAQRRSPPPKSPSIIR
jgi:hypothetical protein